MTSSTDVSSTRAVLKGPIHTMAYPPRAQNKLGSNPFLYEDGEFPCGTSSLVSSYQTAISDERTQAETSSRWPSDRGVLSEHAYGNGDWYKAAGWSMTGSASSIVASLSKQLISFRSLCFWPSKDWMANEKAGKGIART